MESPMSVAIPPNGLDNQPVPVPLIDLVAQYQEIESQVAAAVRRVFSEQRFILGDEVAELEFELAGYCDARQAIGCASGTDALVLALMALDIGPGDEVITSPYTFFATASSIYRLGAKPVFCDIDPVSFNIDPHAVEDAMTSRTKAIMPVHLFGQCAEMEPLQRMAASAGIPIVEDACQAIGAEYQNRRAGVLGTIGCFSFFPTKNLGGAGDGGLLTTDDAGLAARIRRLRVHGEASQYEHIEVGLNSRLDAIQAAVLRIKLRRLDAWTAARQRNARRYEILFDDYGLTDCITLPRTLHDRRHVYNQYCVRVASGQRDKVLAGLRERKIGCSVYYPKPLHLQTCFASLGYKAGDLPHSEQASRDSLALPIYSELTEEQQERVVQGIALALGRTPKRSLQNRIHRPNFLSSGLLTGALELAEADE
jgi:dTDP-4-amino-4,6-dideoxygalactose transaminase